MKKQITNQQKSKDKEVKLFPEHGTQFVGEDGNLYEWYYVCCSGKPLALLVQKKRKNDSGLIKYCPLDEEILP